MKLMDQYEAAIARGEIQDDPSQRGVVVHLQRMADALTAPRPAWYNFGRKKQVEGMYLYGPVGVGKTYLVDMFYNCVLETHKSRFHFHHFMQQVDAQLRRLQGQKNPLLHIAANLAKTTRLLCFDEFLVYDVADAMILSELLQAILAQGVVLVATSNTIPDDLYPDGVQRDRFLPAIALINQHCEVLDLSEKRDYRLGRAPLPHAYLCPLDEVAQQAMTKQFSAIATNVKEAVALSIQSRLVACVKYGDRAVWIKFDEICNMPRCQLDYLEIADRFDTVFVSEIPVFTMDDIMRVTLFIHFIDVMYDRGIRIIMSAAVPAVQLYPKGALHQEFQRTLSRLEEMQSEDYLRRRVHRHIQSL